MTQKIISKEVTRFLTPFTLFNIIKKIEAYCPGWWWSLSQKLNCVTISLGPSKHCPHVYDVAFSDTRLGDRGLVNSFHFQALHQEPEVLRWVDHLFTTIDHHRNGIKESVNDFSNIEMKSHYRKQSHSALNDLSTQYINFQKMLSLLKVRNYTLHELYLGSCELSVDCSLRGLSPNGSEFDISMDLHGYENTIADSLRWSIIELTNEILTHS